MHAQRTLRKAVLDFLGAIPRGEAKTLKQDYGAPRRQCPGIHRKPLAHKALNRAGLRKLRGSLSGVDTSLLMLRTPRVTIDLSAAKLCHRFHDSHLGLGLPYAAQPVRTSVLTRFDFPDMRRTPGERCLLRSTNWMPTKQPWLANR